MPIGPFGIPGMLIGGGMGIAASGRIGEMTLGRYGMGVAAGGLMLGPKDSDTRRGAMMGAGVGAAGYTGYSAFNDYGRVRSAYNMGSTAEGTAEVVARKAIGTTNAAAKRAGIDIAVGEEARSTLQRSLIESKAFEGKGVLVRGARTMGGLSTASREIGGFGKYGISKAMKGGAWGAVAGGVAMGAYGLMRGGSHMRSNEPMY